MTPSLGIPHAPAQPGRRLLTFHDENTYLIAMYGERSWGAPILVAARLAST